MQMPWAMFPLLDILSLKSYDVKSVHLVLNAKGSGREENMDTLLDRWRHTDLHTQAHS